MLGQVWPSQEVTDPSRKRKRAVISCTECHRRKQKVRSPALEASEAAINLFHSLVRPRTAVQPLPQAGDTSMLPTPTMNK